MNRMMMTIIFLVVTLLCANAFGAQNKPPVPLATLDSTETAQLLFMREEEKLARDIYDGLYGLWGYKVFLNISRAEQNHMDAMLKMLDNFAIEDPVPSDAAGSFSNADLTALFPQLTDWGDDSLLAAFRVGGWVEETDIADLRRAILDTDEPMLINSYSNLLAASRNHLRTFVSHVVNLGEVYSAQVLDQADVDEIVGDYNVIPGENFSINAGLNDAWFYPDTSGQGFFITVFPVEEIVFLAWFTYDTDLPAEGVVANLGDPGQRWMTAQGSFSGAQADLEIDFMSGGLFDTSDAAPIHKAGGSILLQFDNCSSGSVFYDIPSIDLSGFIPIVRIMSDNVPLCQELNAITQ